jgi:hypothetical protein
MCGQPQPGGLSGDVAGGRANFNRNGCGNFPAMTRADSASQASKKRFIHGIARAYA